MNIDGATLISKSDKFVETEADDETILMHLENGRFFRLGDTAKQIWEMLDTPQTITSLCSRLSQEYDVAEDQCTQDIIALMARLQDRNLIDATDQATS